MLAKGMQPCVTVLQCVLFFSEGLLDSPRKKRLWLLCENVLRLDGDKNPVKPRA